MKNGKHKTNSFDSFNSWSKKQSLLPSFQGGAGGRLFPLTKREAWLTLFHIGVLCDARFALTKIIPRKKCEQKGCYPQINL